MPVKKIPPPIGIAEKDQILNRWLVELTNILNAGGTIDPNDVDGLPALILQVAVLAVQVFSLSGQVSTNTGDITTLQGQVATNTAGIAANTLAIAALAARNQVYNGTGAPAGALGVVGDWYGDVAGIIGSRIWIKTGAATWTAFPF